MSTFLGFIEEIPGISVDRFNNKNKESSVFFLSHCHSDHTRGLCYSFWNMLQDRGLFLYCSPISKTILESQFLDVKGINVIQSLQICDPVIVSYKDSNNAEFVKVTSIPSGHCPGSVMFLFEKNDQVILYTGDFRICPNDFRNLKPLHDLQYVPKKLHKIYLDTTFLNLDFKYFPNRKECAFQICSVLQDWLDENSRNVVVLECSANYGAEFIFEKIAEKLGKKIHVKDFLYEIYLKMDKFSRYVTNETMTTPIHACMNKSDRNVLKCRPCSDVKIENIMTVVPSAMIWKGKDLSRIWQWDQTRDNTLNVCYSTHASYEELVAFLKYFKPDEVYPCVCKKEQRLEMYHLLREIAKESEQKKDDKKEYVLSKSLQERSDLNSFKSKHFSDQED
ncbi:protein artemis isoform X2 [Cephus cinctus]|uniref:Protein artemis n=1 Tax=Cephus cinctus TaxID=211228 RepID=A0AAJ7RA18_CEPCN|nr:protein artemis isoform X2 [Cephus cinctus]XP_015587954.1 protein artemis isoform X2 [Cephus cinctus]XP_024937122.1 protein artemis isoform X2 [Cephus cinctus]